MFELHPTDYHTVDITVRSKQHAERVVAAVRSEGLMAHVEDYDDWLIVYVATPQWVRDYYRNGGTWGYGPFPE